MRALVARALVAILLLGSFADAASAQSRRSRRKPAHQTAPAASEPAAADSGNELQDLDSEAKPAPDTSNATSDAGHSAAEQPAEDAAPPADAEAAPAESSDAESAPAAPRGPDVSVDPFLGTGIGTRSFRRPTKLGGQSMPDELLPVVDVGMAFHAWPQQTFSWTVLVRYQTSIGFRAQEDPSFGLPNRVSVRADRLELSVAPTFRFGDAPGSAQLAFPIGASVRGFWPEVHNLVIPRYTMSGPLARAELQFGLLDALTLRIGPELEWILLFSRHLTNNGVKPEGIAVGGEVGLRLALSAIFALDLSYRQSTAMANVKYGPTFRDVERFLTLRLVGTM